MKKFLREPLFHFLVLGTGLFLLSHWRGGAAGGSSSPIIVTRARIEQLAVAFARTWQRPPSPQEMKGLVDDYIREEIYFREAVSMGLDRDDTIIRRRMRQKFEFLTEDALDAASPKDEDLRAYLKAHPDSFRVEPRVAFRQVFLDPGRRGAAVESDARALLTRLSSGGAGVDFASLGDSRMLPSEIELSPQSDVAQVFGPVFAARVVSLAPGAWAGPIASGYGLHLVQVTERVESRLPELAEVRSAVDREWRAAQRRERSEALFRGLLARYKVVFEPPAADARPAAAGNTSP